MPRILEGKFGIVTGGSRGTLRQILSSFGLETITQTFSFVLTRGSITGIGEAIAHNLAEKGCSLLLIYTSATSQARTEQLSATLAKTHSIECSVVQADLGKPEEAVEKIMARAKQSADVIDILINNAGISEDRMLNDPAKGPIDPAYFQRQYTVNVLAPLLLTQACAPYLPTSPSAPRGRIVNISSVSSSMGFTGQSVYGGTKAALEAMTRTWARELASRATVNSVNPGPVVGDMYFATGEAFWKQMQGYQDSTPLSELRGEADEVGLGPHNAALVRDKMGGRRPAFTREVAGIVAMLCTPDAEWTTGSVVCGNGGMRMGI